MRGKVLYVAAVGIYGRITPAYAGKSSIPAGCCSDCRDHPRVCGEKNLMKPSCVSHPGSPPRMRGKVGRMFPCWLRLGITPAYAGKSERLCSQCRTAWDHPRVCGEKKSTVSLSDAGRGSPPRMRGKAQQYIKLTARERITPAYAGKRLKRSHSIGHFSCILCLFHSVLHRASVSDGSRAGPCAPPCLPAQNAVPV